MVLTLRQIAVLALPACLLGACTGQELRPVETVLPSQPAGAAPSADDHVLKQMFEPWSDAVPAYRIGEGDKLKVIFPHTTELSEDVTVRPDGMITLQATGDVLVAGLSTTEATKAVTEKAARRLRDPQVMIEVADPVSSSIYVGGEVKTAGVYPLKGPMTVPEALQLASGTAETARIDEVILIRRAPDGRQMLRLVDVHGLLEGKPVDNPRVLQGDIVFVPRTRIAEIGLWEQLFIERVVPFQRVFTYTTGQATLK